MRLLIATTIVAASPAAAEEPYSLFNPKPREAWRPLSADRPDFTESPYTVDAGAVQLEASFVDFASNGRTDTWTAGAANLKFGLLDGVDLQLVFDAYVHEDSGTSTDDGFGDTQLRLKLNVWGNDGGDSAGAIMPFIKLPTASSGLSNDHVEGGLIFPFATDLREGLGLGLMFETDFVYDELDDDYDTEFIATAALGMDLTEDIGLYVEGIGIASTDADVDERAIIGVGATKALDADTVLDAGVNIGLHGDADDVNVFAGITIRF